MKHLVVFAHSKGFGNCECVFNHYPPTMEDVTGVSKELKEKGIEDVVILNWMEISDNIQ